MKLFEWLDARQFLRLRTWDFCFRSITREYGRDFFKKVICRHPIRTIRGIQQYRQMKWNESLPDHGKNPGIVKGNIDLSKSIVGVGFCLKPLQPACISGRANHDCYFLERGLVHSPKDPPACCRNCRIKELGLLSLSSGSRFYIMTSARDILYDLILPSLEKKQFTQGVFVICRYSFEPFNMALLIAGVTAQLFPFEKNDCQDYPTWLLADVGIKELQTEVNSQDVNLIQDLFVPINQIDLQRHHFLKNGNIFYPQ